MEHIRAVVNQAGVAMELHEHDGQTPIMLTLIRPAELELYKAELAKSNPDFRHANRIYPGMTVSQTCWTYNASSDTYERG